MSVLTAFSQHIAKSSNQCHKTKIEIREEKNLSLFPYAIIVYLENTKKTKKKVTQKNLI